MRKINVMHRIYIDMIQIFVDHIFMWAKYLDTKLLYINLKSEHIECQEERGIICHSIIKCQHQLLLPICTWTLVEDILQPDILPPSLSFSHSLSLSFSLSSYPSSCCMLPISEIVFVRIEQSSNHANKICL